MLTLLMSLAAILHLAGPPPHSDAIGIPTLLPGMSYTRVVPLSGMYPVDPPDFRTPWVAI